MKIVRKHAENNEKKKREKMKKAYAENRRRPLNFGAGYKSRTHDLLITNQLLYQLSYAGDGPGL